MSTWVPPFSHTWNLKKKLNTRLKTPKVKNFKTSIKQSDFNWIFLPYDWNCIWQHNIRKITINFLAIIIVVPNDRTQ